MIKIAQRVVNIPPSPTMEGDRKARAMRAEGKDVLSFAIGEPDFPTPDNIIHAAKRAMDEQKTKYTTASGIDELKQAICQTTEATIGLSYEPSQVCVSGGAKHALANVFGTMLDPGDEVIVIAPYWVSYPDLIRLYDGVPVEVVTTGAENFQPCMQKVADAITDRTVAIVVNSPNNPTGGVIDDEVLADLAALIVERDLVLLTDEIYKDIVFDGRRHSSPAALPGMKDRSIIIDGVSKSYSMTGWRIGWTLGPSDFIRNMGNLQSQMTANPNSIAQWAAVEALTGPQDAVEKMRKAFQQRRDYLVPALCEIEGIKCTMPAGAFYVFPDISAYLGQTVGKRQLNSSKDFCDYLLEEAWISSVPGSGFGAEGYFRISFACSMEQIEEGIRRIREALTKA
jgi:aspartate aminotransferase